VSVLAGRHQQPDRSNGAVHSGRARRDRLDADYHQRLRHTFAVLFWPARRV